MEALIPFFEILFWMLFSCMLGYEHKICGDSFFMYRVTLVNKNGDASPWVFFAIFTLLILAGAEVWVMAFLGSLSSFFASCILFFLGETEQKSGRNLVLTIGTDQILVTSAFYRNWSYMPLKKSKLVQLNLIRGGRLIISRWTPIREHYVFPSMEII